MGNIVVMSQDLANKISAGEVVERPLSIVKELVENSIDANSKNINITIKNAGIDFINVTDDGDGMDKVDAELCFKRHASSKLTSDEMLFKIATLGFRGEALSSIAAVSRVEMETCNESESTRIVIEAGEVVEKKSASFRKGTSITVTKLFYNTPARLKYITSLYSESAKIVEYVNKCALANPNISFKLMHDGKSVIETSGSGNNLKCIRDVYSINIAKEIEEIGVESEEYSISMFVAKPSFQRSNKNYISIFVNKRVVHSPTITKAIIGKYSNYMTKGRFPFVILNITIEPELIDVNIHPNKYEIKFSKHDEIISVIEELLNDYLSSTSHIVEVKKDYIKTNEVAQTFNFEREYSETNKVLEVKESIQPGIEIINRGDEVNVEEVNTFDLDSELVDNTIISENDVEENRVKYYEPIGQYNGTYILCQGSDELVMIDQHAAMERINYEKNRDMFASQDSEVVDLLVPIIVSYSMEEAIIIKDNLHLLQELNIDISEFGNSDFVVRSIPLWLGEGVEQQVIELMLEKILQNETLNILDIKDDVIELMSCKESLKANSRLTINEMEVLIDRLFKCDNPYYCPHGRPVIVSLSIKEIEKLFNRIV